MAKYPETRGLQVSSCGSFHLFQKCRALENEWTGSIHRSSFSAQPRTEDIGRALPSVGTPCLVRLCCSGQTRGIIPVFENGFIGENAESSTFPETAPFIV